MFDMSQVMILDGGQSRSITGENKEGKKGAGGQASGELGKGRKGSPCTSLLTGELFSIFFSRLQIKQKKDVLF